MIKFFILFTFLVSSLYASKILSYNVYERTDRADVMLTFDTPYRGAIKQSKGNSKIIIKLYGASIESSKVRNVSSEYLSSIAITPMLNKTQILATVPSYVKLVASKTSDSYGLRLRFIKKSTLSKNENSTKTQDDYSNAGTSTNLPTIKSTQMSQSYYVVVIILILGIIILFYLRKKIPTQKENNNFVNKNNWLFKDNKESTPALENQSEKSDKLSIRFQKELDSKNSVVMLDFSEYSYLLIVGEGNILLDKFTNNKPVTQEDFNSILKERHQELSDFLESKKDIKNDLQDTPLEALQSYKEKAASMIYES